MKRFVSLLIILLLASSCQKDDDSLAPQCNLVTDISSGTITSNTATISWNHDTLGDNFTLEYGITDFTQGTGTSLQVNSTSITLTGLMANTSYDFYLRSNCSIDNFSLWTTVQNFTTSPPLVVPELSANLSDFNLFSGDLKDLIPTAYAFEYDLNTPLFTDYAHKQRLIALPENTTMQFNGDGLPIFPDNTVIAKTFYYNLNERDLSLGRQIIETRILIKINGEWETGDYKWNTEQTEAVLDLEGSSLPVTWIDADGNTNSTVYKIPSNADCFTCHKTYENLAPIGPKLRTMNFDINGTNQLQQFINDSQLSGLSDVSTVNSLPNWEDTSVSLEERTRAYFDINCAHCHIPGGQCEDQSDLNLAYETLLENSNIIQRKQSILFRVSEFNEGISMPFIGTTLLHTEGVELIQAYIDTL